MMVNPHPVGSYWYKMAELFGAPDIKYCEKTLASFISEPANTWSNLLLIFVGLYFHFTKKKKGSLFDHYGLSVALMGLFSFTYHLSNNYLTQLIDFLGMYAAIGIILFVNLKKLGFINDLKAKRYYYLSLIIYGLFVHLFRVLNLPVQQSLGVIILFILISEVTISLKSKKELSYYSSLFKGLGCLVIAVIFQLIDIHRVYCDSDNHFLQPHALWHLFNGLAFYFYYDYFSKRDSEVFNG